MSSYITFLCLLAILLPTCLSSYPRPTTCKAKVNGKWMVVQEGEVVKVKKSTVDICEGGKIRTKHKSNVPQPLMLACGGCQWKGAVVCSGDIVQDLYVWWFESRCSEGKMRPVGRSYSQVVADSRYISHANNNNNNVNSFNAHPRYASDANSKIPQHPSFSTNRNIRARHQQRRRYRSL